MVRGGGESAVGVREEADASVAVVPKDAARALALSSERFVALRCVSGHGRGLMGDVDEWSRAEVVAAACGAAERLSALLEGGAARAASSRRRGSSLLVGVSVADGDHTLPLCLLACHLAGLAVLPLDAAHEPARRLARKLAVATPALVVAAGELEAARVEAAKADAATKAAGAGDIRIVLAADVGLGISRRGGEAPSSLSARLAALPGVARPFGAAGDGRALSHAFFTSGSTGAPKACLATRRALALYCRGKNSKFGVGAGDAVLVASPHTFDPSLGDFFSAWAAGACAAVAPRGVLLAYLGAALEATRASHLLCTPTLLQTLQQPEAAAWPPSLRVIGLGGEAMPKTLAARLTTAPAPNTLAPRSPALLNCYGVTECCVYQSACEVRGPQDARVISPSGLPWAHTTLHLAAGGGADRSSLVEDRSGELGEVWIVGELVSEGYLGRPEENAARFFDTAFRTGDIARARADGKWVLVGRRDAQVKLRGRRVELGEIEAAILDAGNDPSCEGGGSALPLLAGVACTVAQSGAAAGALVAFCAVAASSGLAPSPSCLEVGESGSCDKYADVVAREVDRPADAPDAEGDAERRRVAAAVLRRRLSALLPEHMLPARFEFWAQGALPLTASGKVARGRLARCALVDEPCDADGSDEVAADGGSGWESLVASAFSAELGVRVDRRGASLLALGGDSLAALRVCQRLTKVQPVAADRDADGSGKANSGSNQFGELLGALAPIELIRRPTVREFARHLTRSFGDIGTSNTPDVPPTLSASTQGRVREEDGEGYTLLRKACLVGLPWAVGALLADGVPPLVAPPHAPPHAHPLHCAAARGRAGCVEMLLCRGATTNAAAADGGTALHAAANCGNVAVVAALLGAGANPYAENSNSMTAAAVAARAGHPKALLRLLETETSTISERSVGGSKRGSNSKKLQAKARAGQKALVDRKVRHGATLTQSGFDHI